ncbi:MAG: hypothetical protein DMF80_14615 [Acidobacteria bacterium]|nr:MAG: hypothetical protein DMF80_14615 [Acidobacteriota bacterium]PYQ22808.1 MAG: hypothetical protein DMF81_10860 [Acidobacteriota bacterium]
MTEARPFPESLCHSCAAPPRYVTSDRGSVFVYCPVFRAYPPQPVLSCAAYRPQGSAPPGASPGSGPA